MGSVESKRQALRHKGTGSLGFTAEIETCFSSHQEQKQLHKVAPCDTTETEAQQTPQLEHHHHTHMPALAFSAGEHHIFHPGRRAAHGQALPATTGLQKDTAEKPGCFLAQERHFRAKAALLCRNTSPQAYREFPSEFACIKVEQNTNQHDMQRAELLLSLTYTHTYINTVEQGNTHLTGRTLGILS